MKNILMLIATVAVCTTAFYRPKCEHVFTQVEQPVIKINEPVFTLGGGVYQEHIWPYGVQDGKDIICVKCFHVQRQKIDYGQPYIDTCRHWSWTIKEDTARSEGNAIAQREHKCKTGYECIPTIATSGYKMVGGCFPDSVARKKLNAFYKAMCEETQTGEFSDNLSYENRHVWYDSTGCVECKIWKVLRNGKWIEITKKEYDSLGALK